MPDIADQIEALLRGAGDDAGTDGELRDAVKKLEKALAGQPDDSLRARLMTSCDDELEAFVGRVAQFLDLPEERARTLLDRARSDPANWPEHPFDQLALMPVELGPRHGAARGMVLHLAPGAEIPRHGHKGDEWGFILSGALADDVEPEKGPGDLVYRSADVIHRVWNPGPGPALLLNVIQGGYDWSPTTMGSE